MNKKKLMGLLVSAALLTGTMTAPVLADTTNESFTDVQNTHWAAADIEFAAEKGIVNGYDMGGGKYAFRPENSVSYEEAATMLYRALLAAGKVEETQSGGAEQSQETGDTEEQAEGQSEGSQSAGPYDELLAANGIADWAKKYVAYGLEQGIIEEEELAAFINKDTGFGKAAPRITVAIWTAKAMEKAFGGVYYLPFTDADKIEDSEAPYVDLLRRQGIMKGSLQPDGTTAFLPDDGVKRSEFAAISNRVYNSEASQGYDVDKETFLYTIETGRRLPDSEIRFAPEFLLVYGAAVDLGEITEVSGRYSVISEKPLLISGITLKTGELPQVHIDEKAQALSGKIRTVENLSPGIIKLGIEIEKEIIYYIFDESTVSTAKITKGTQVSFIADGITLIEAM